MGARKKCQEEYKSLLSGPETPDLAVEKSNKGHGYFIVAIETIFEILEPCLRPIASLPVSNTPSSISTNVFELLEMEDCLDEDISTIEDLFASETSKRIVYKPSRDESAMESEAQHTQRSWRVQVFYAIEKIQDIRAKTQSIWQEYLDGKIDMIVASFVTEMAFQLITEIEHDKMFFTVDGEAIEPLNCALEALDMFTPKEFPLEFLNFNPLWEWNEFYFLRFKFDIDKWLERIPQNKEKFGQILGNDSSPLDRIATTDLEKWQEHGSVLNNLIGSTISVHLNAAMSSSNRHNLGNCDSFTTGLAELVKRKAKKTNSLAICVHVQLLLEIHLILRKKVTQPCKELKIVLMLYRKMAVDYQNFFDKHPFSVIRGDAYTAEWVEKLNQVIPSIDGNGLEERSIPDSPFSQNPVLCGLNCLKVYAHLQREGLKTADNAWFVMPVAHLYNALKQLGHVVKPWRRMEQFLEIHSPQSIFNGTTPTTLESCHSKIRSSCGYSATIGFSDQQPPWRRVRPRSNLVPNLGTLSALLQKHLLDDDRGLVASLRHFYHTQQSSEDSGLSDNHGNANFLDFIKTHLSSELKHLKFDYFALNKECIKILHTLLVGFAKEFITFGMTYYHDSIGKEARSMRDIVSDLLFFALKGWQLQRLVEGGTTVLGTCAFMLEICIGTGNLRYEYHKHLWESNSNFVWGK